MGQAMASLRFDLKQSESEQSLAINELSENDQTLAREILDVKTRLTLGEMFSKEETKDYTERLEELEEALFVTQTNYREKVAAELEKSIAQHVRQAQVSE